MYIVTLLCIITVCQSAVTRDVHLQKHPGAGVDYTGLVDCVQQ